MKLFSSNLQSPIGELESLTDDSGVVRALQFADCRSRYERYRRAHFGSFRAEHVTAPRALSSALAAYFSGDLDALDDLLIAPAGTQFELQVWTALRKIEVGTTVHYGKIARKLGLPDPRAAIDVGAANGSNPIAIIVPCHRVIAKDGSLKGYAWGVQRKRWLLEHEGAMRRVDDTAAVSETLALPGF
jgi:methylated-DNA-[protein]-cysteine S-methyltransferase